MGQSLARIYHTALVLSLAPRLCYALLDLLRISAFGILSAFGESDFGFSSVRLTVWHRCHTLYGMKMTLHIDEELLARVMEVTGTTSKTKAIDLALREMDRKAKLINLGAAGLGLTPDELKDAVDPAYDLNALRRSETPVSYARKPRSR